jgi:hypothetical protein
MRTFTYRSTFLYGVNPLVFHHPVCFTPSFLFTILPLTRSSTLPLSPFLFITPPFSPFLFTTLPLSVSIYNFLFPTLPFFFTLPLYSLSSLPSSSSQPILFPSFLLCTLPLSVLPFSTLSRSPFLFTARPLYTLPLSVLPLSTLPPNTHPL